MGSAFSRCSTSLKGNSNMLPCGPELEIGQRILENQPNWLTTPSRWRSKTPSHQPVRYRTPTPYPKDDRRPLPDVEVVHLSEKKDIVETHTPASARHIEVVEPPRRHKPMSSNIPRLQLPPAVLTITWEQHPRRNRFERVG
ncbi:hypothetical protein QBC47DRAFT_54104 [Echria macrotheca]|uniref:Uncharacterized protein n=1 Tax=Echria macrotheca TaxID=438768 RepID=A0AAJ0B8K8_9PEZI|nr:hypothetical protein QBC47DRAFT_54104 [Echria macrotheca]